MGSIKPKSDELPKAHDIIRETIEECQEIKELSNLTICTGGSSFDWVEDRGGAVGNAKDSKTIELTFNSEVDNWEKTLEKSTCFAYGRAVYIDRKGSTNHRWQKLLSIILGQKISYQITSSQPETEEISLESERITEDLREEVADWKDKFFEGEDYPPQFGYKLARKLASHLQIQQIIDLDREELLKHAEKTLRSDK